MYAVRLWSVRHARGLSRFYTWFEQLLVWKAPLYRWLGYSRIERPTAAVERVVKGFLFDCRMCGQCVLSSTGMSCPMNCPKQLRNGPCGGVRANVNENFAATVELALPLTRKVEAEGDDDARVFGSFTARY